MPTNLLLEGEDLQELLRRAHSQAGPQARIVRAAKVRRGGILGFFARQAFEVAVEVPDEGSPAAATAPAPAPASVTPAPAPVSPAAPAPVAPVVPAAAAAVPAAYAPASPATHGASPNVPATQPLIAGPADALAALREDPPPHYAGHDHPLPAAAQDSVTQTKEDLFMDDDLSSFSSALQAALTSVDPPAAQATEPEAAAAPEQSAPASFLEAMAAQQEEAAPAAQPTGEPVPFRAGLMDAQGREIVPGEAFGAALPATAEAAAPEAAAREAEAPSAGLSAEAVGPGTDEIPVVTGQWDAFLTAPETAPAVPQPAPAAAPAPAPAPAAAAPAPATAAPAPAMEASELRAYLEQAATDHEQALPLPPHRADSEPAPRMVTPGILNGPISTPANSPKNLANPMSLPVQPATPQAMPQAAPVAMPMPMPQAMPAPQAMSNLPSQPTASAVLPGVQYEPPAPYQYEAPQHEAAQYQATPYEAAPYQQGYPGQQAPAAFDDVVGINPTDSPVDGSMDTPTDGPAAASPVAGSHSVMPQRQRGATAWFPTDGLMSLVRGRSRSRGRGAMRAVSISSQAASSESAEAGWAQVARDVTDTFADSADWSSSGHATAWNTDNILTAPPTAAETAPHWSTPTEHTASTVSTAPAWELPQAMQAMPAAQATPPAQTLPPTHPAPAAPAPQAMQAPVLPTAIQPGQSPVASLDWGTLLKPTGATAGLPTDRMPAAVAHLAPAPTLTRDPVAEIPGQRAPLTFAADQLAGLAAEAAAGLTEEAPVDQVTEVSFGLADDTNPGLMAAAPAPAPALTAPAAAPVPAPRPAPTAPAAGLTEAVAELNDDETLTATRRHLRALGVPLAWTGRLRSGERFSAVLDMLSRMPTADLNPNATVVALIGPRDVVELEAHRTALDLPVGSHPRQVAVIPAGAQGEQELAAATASGQPVVLALEYNGEQDLPGLRASLRQARPDLVIAILDARDRLENVTAWVEALERLDAICIEGALDVAAPAALLHLDLPVIRMDGVPVDRFGWAALLCAHLNLLDSQE